MTLCVVFLGNHTVGVETLQVLTERAQLAAVVAHPPDPEDGVRYASVHDWARERGIPVMRGRASDPAVAAFVRGARPDLLWITDYRYLLPEALLTAAPLGAVNLHPSLLPAYRGRAPINWAILRGETRLGLTAHRVSEGVDTGAILEQIDYTLGLDEDVGDALRKLLPLYREITVKVLAQFEHGFPAGRPQPPTDQAPWPARKPEHGEIDWTAPAAEVLNLVRAVAKPYPGASSSFQGRRLVVWKGCIAALASSGSGARPGTVLTADSGRWVVQCGGGALELAEVTWDGPPPALRPGDRLGQGVEEEAATVRHYEGLYARHGDSHSALDWGSQAGQELRFRVLAGIGDLAGASVLDVGCGLAHFADWLQQRAPGVQYTGLDLVPGLLGAACQRRPDLRLVGGSIQDDSVLAGESFDYVFASGIFYTYAAGADRVLQASVRRMWSLARRGVAFNALGTHAPDQVAGEYYADPQAVLRFCRELSPCAELVIGYHPRDFTVYLHRAPA